MSTDLESIKKTLVGISRGDGILDTLLEFERTLDNAELFAYKNWILGELVEGPDIGRYWYRVVLMYPYELMPDPEGGLRLTKVGAKVNFRKGTFKRPTKVEGPEDWVDPQTKRAKMIKSKVWLVTIELPIKYINRGLENSEQIMQRDIENTEKQLNDAYEEGVEEEPITPEGGDLGAAEMPEMPGGPEAAEAQAGEEL